MEGRTLSQTIQRKIKLDIALYTVGVPIAFGVVLFVIDYFKGKGFELEHIGLSVLIFSIPNLFTFYFQLREQVYLTGERITGDLVTIEGLTIKNLLSKKSEVSTIELKLDKIESIKVRKSGKSRSVILKFLNDEDLYERKKIVLIKDPRFPETQSSVLLERM